MLRYSEQSTSTTPASLPVSLEVKEVAVSHLLALLGLALVLLAAAAGLGWLAAAARLPAPALSLLLSLAVLAAVLLAGLVVWLVAAELRARLRHHEMIAAWHDAALARYESGLADSVESRAVSLDLLPSNPMHLLAVALYLHQRCMLGATPSVRVLAGAFFLAGRRVGDVSKEDAQLLLAELSRRGLIAGRGDRVAGRWLPESYDDVVSVLLENKRLEDNHGCGRSPS